MASNKKGTNGGVLTYNNDTREEMLKMNSYSNYSFFDDTEDSFSSVSSHDYDTLSSKMTLMEYTHSGNTQYSKKINDRYLNVTEDRDVYDVVSEALTNVDLWFGKYENYIDYIATIYGAEYTTYKFANEILSDSTFNNNGKILNSVGVVKAIDAFNNVGGYKSTDADTRMGRIARQVLEKSMESVVNEESELEKDYSRKDNRITKTVYQSLGVNENTYPNLGNGFDIDDETGRIAGGQKYTETPFDVYDKDDIDSLNDYISTKYLLLKYFNNTEGNTMVSPLLSLSISGYSVDTTINDGPEDNGMKLSGATTFKKAESTDALPKAFFYDEGDTEGTNGSYSNNEGTNEADRFENNDAFSESELGQNNILSKTNKLFNEHKINTLISRFHTSNDFNESDTCDDLISSGKDKTWGYSVGRALLKKNPSSGSNNGYANPYCRAWTWHHQYNTYKDTIRSSENFSQKQLQSYNKKYRSKFNSQYLNEDGGTYLTNNSVLMDNGLVRIAPSSNANDGLTHYMFSLENLAWKDVKKNGNRDIDNEQWGPNGGRIMWFPPYDIDFQENVSVNWNENTFIGRGENVYTYTNTQRTGSLSFTLLVDHPALLNSFAKQNGKITEDDILRFFAGCGDGSFDVDEDPVVSNPEIPKPQEPEEKPAEPQYGDKNVFYVFFPNNFSGNNRKNDWADYLATGRNTIISSESGTDKSVFRGYLMNGESLSDENYTKESKANTNKIHNWYYDVDNDKLGQIITGTVNKKTCYDNYYDSGATTCFKETQTKGILYANSRYTMAKSLIMEHYSDEPTLSFGEFIYALKSINTNTKKRIKANSLTESGLTIAENFKNWISGDVKYNFEVVGYATNQDNKNADTLAKRRAHSVSQLIRENFNSDKYGISIKTSSEVKNVNGSKDVNSDESRMCRAAKVIIYKDVPEVINADETEENSTNTNFQNGLTVEGGVYKTYTSYNSYKYKNEYEFFNDIEREDPVAFKKITDKIKYFNPAYHSMSPEGFNARLTFLQQCTRQGHTISNSESAGETTQASNLAFGRMPVCVLRLGDFINTRVLIQSMSIQYSDGGMQWDLNPEGAGVQPMFAKVSLNVVILGGQTLDAPISRLQNAVSFNYYANTGVYDDRADRASYTTAKDGTIDYKHLYIVNQDEVRNEVTSTNGTGNSAGNNTDESSNRNSVNGSTKENINRNESPEDALDNSLDVTQITYVDDEVQDAMNFKIIYGDNLSINSTNNSANFDLTKSKIEVPTGSKNKYIFVTKEGDYFIHIYNKTDGNYKIKDNIKIDAYYNTIEQ